MGGICRSDHRCGQLACEKCARRYAGGVTRRMMRGEVRNLCAVEIELAPSLADFWSWRVEARNVVDYRRRTDRWWRDLALSVWLNQDGMMRGIVALGPVTPDEFLAVFSRWPTALRPITPSDIARRNLRDCPAFAACFSSIAAQAISESETHNSGSTQRPENNLSIERESRQPLSRTNAYSLLKEIHEISYPETGYLRTDYPSSPRHHLSSQAPQLRARELTCPGALVSR